MGLAGWVFVAVFIAAGSLFVAFALWFDMEWVEDGDDK